MTIGGWMRRAHLRAKALGALASLAAVAVLLTGCTSDPHTVTAWPAQASGGFDQSTQSQLSAAVTDAMKMSGASGAIVGVWAPWAGSWTAGLGTTETAGKTPVTTDMEFRIGQNTASMTCTVLLALVNAGKVKLDDPVSKFLPQMTGISGVTLEQLCQNTSGIGDYTAQLSSQFVNNPTRVYQPLELITDGMGNAVAGSSSGAFSYSNAGFVLLGAALQAATSLSWAQLYTQYIFDPLNMASTSYPNTNQTTIPGPHPDGYATAENNSGVPTCGTVVDVTQLSPTSSYTAGAVVSTLSDLHAYSKALAKGSLLTPALSADQWKTVSQGTTAPAWAGYGLGSAVLGPMRGQAGSTPGFLSVAFSDPTSGLSVVVMLNNSSSGSGFVQALGMELAAIASKAPAKSKSAKPATLPWTTDQAAASLKAATICPPAAAAAAPAG